MPTRRELEALGIYIPPMEEKIEFSVRLNPDNTGSIFIKTRRPVRNPAIHFILQTSWPKGNKQREYTFLIDPKPITKLSDNLIKSNQIMIRNLIQTLSSHCTI